MPGALTSGTCTLESFGYSDEDAFAVGLTGVVQPVLSAEHPEVTESLAMAAARGSVAVARVVRGPAERVGEAVFVRADGTIVGDFADPVLEAMAGAQAKAFLEARRTGTIDISPEEGSPGTAAGARSLSG
ncbi:XdhC family protein [Streptomyces flaveolus]|uniref:XdhC family protein n=1 Tax=Streptomyces flaveolus TaxID=67297 RepID=UPI00381D3B97